MVGILGKRIRVQIELLQSSYHPRFIDVDTTSSTGGFRMVSSLHCQVVHFLANMKLSGPFKADR